MIFLLLIGLFLIMLFPIIRFYDYTTRTHKKTRYIAYICLIIGALCIISFSIMMMIQQGNHPKAV